MMDKLKRFAKMRHANMNLRRGGKKQSRKLFSDEKNYLFHKVFFFPASRKGEREEVVDGKTRTIYLFPLPLSLLVSPGCIK